MAEYVYMQNYNRYGKMGISYKVIEHVATDVVATFKGIKVSDSPKDHPIRCSITKGKAYLKLDIKIKEGSNASKVAGELQEDIANGLLNNLELSDCVININVIGIF